MIVQFTFKNYRSYKGEVSFTFEALESDFLSCNCTLINTNYSGVKKLLNSAGIFGANASGKSNVIWALHDLSEMVRNSRNNDVRTGFSTYRPFIFDETSRNSPTEMCIEFIAKGKLYKYEIQYTLICQHEALYIHNGEKYDLMFCKDYGDNGNKLRYGDSKINPVTSCVLKGDLYPNQLFLSYVGVNPQNGWEDAYEELAYIETEPVANSINLKQNNEDAAGRILSGKDKTVMQQLNRLIKISDMGIDGIEVKEHSIDEFKMPVPEEIRRLVYEQNKWEFNAIHNIKTADGTYRPQKLNMQNESTGTKSIFGVGARVFDVLNRGGILAYDEMNVALHPVLFSLIVSLFNNPKSNPKGAQLLFTTHDASIAREGTLRADQIWFAEKGENGQSDLYSAQDFDDASINMPFEKWYRAGRFGALPKIGNIDYIFD